MRDPHNHQSRGFGFITFQRDDSAKHVLQNRYHDMLGKRVEVKSAVPRGQAPPPQRAPLAARRVMATVSQEADLDKEAQGGGYGYGVQTYSGSNNPWGINSGFGGSEQHGWSSDPSQWNCEEQLWIQQRDRWDSSSRPDCRR